jgi:putative ABC transport system permease protein
MSIVWRKVLRDLWRSKFRTILVVISTAVGVFALGLVYGMSGVLNARLAESHRESVPPHITFYTSYFDQEVVETIKREPDVSDAEGIKVALIKWKQEGDDDWQDGYVFARADYEAQHINIFDLQSGQWPTESSTRRTMSVERMTARHYHLSTGSEIVVEFGRRERRLPIEGVMRHPEAIVPPLSPAVFVATPETVAWLADQPEEFNRLYVRMASFEEEMPDEERAEQIAEALQKRLERMGVYVGLYTITDPDVHPIQETVDAVSVILTVLGVLALALSGFLIVNMMNAVVHQQIWQIGVLKVVGATAGRVLRTYLTTALIYGLLSLFLAVPFGAVAAYLLAGVLLNLFNVNVGGFRLMPQAVGIQVAVGLFVPLLAALVPVIGGARITPHQAISTYGLGGGFGRSWFDRLIGLIRSLPRPFALSLRNTFRRKARIVLTLITLVLGGVMFIVVMSVSASMDYTLEVLLDQLAFDVLVVFDRAYRDVRLVDVAERVPGVTGAELWDQRAAELALESGEEREMYLWAVPPDSKIFHPHIVSGRPLRPGDGKVILLNTKIAYDEGIEVGDTIELTIGDKESTWTVVGLNLNVNNLQRDNFVPFDALARETGNVNRGALLMVTSEQHDETTHKKLIRDLRGAYSDRNMEPVILQSAAEVRQSNKIVFSAVTYLMLAMAVLAAAVGSVGLMSTMSINVVERRREIGVMRAIGATSIAITGIFCAEGILVGVLSWLIAVPLSYPGSVVFNNLVSDKLFQIPLDFSFSFGGLVLWLIIVIVLSAIASLWPALSATQVSVRESLAYE